MNDDRSFRVGAIVLPLDSVATRFMVVLLAMVVILALVAGTLALNRTSDLALHLGEAIGKAESDAGYARAKAEDAKGDADRSEREARLAEYYAVDLKEYMAEHGLHPPDSPWSKPTKGARK